MSIRGECLLVFGVVVVMAMATFTQANEKVPIVHIDMHEACGEGTPTFSIEYPLEGVRPCQRQQGNAIILDYTCFRNWTFYGALTGKYKLEYMISGVRDGWNVGTHKEPVDADWNDIVNHNVKVLLQQLLEFILLVLVWWYIIWMARGRTDDVLEYAIKAIIVTCLFMHFYL